MNLVNSKKILNSISDYVLVVDYKYRILYINNSLSNKIGYKNDEIEMLNVFKTLFKEEWRAQSIFSELINNEEKELPVNIYTKYEEKIKLAVKVIKNCWQDEKAYYILCKEKNTEEQEELSKEIKRLMDNVPYYLWANDKEGKILFANKSFAEFFSRDKEELYGKTYIDLLSMDTGIKMMNSDKKIMEGKKAKFFTQELKVGEKKHCFEHYKMPMINGNNDVMGVMGVSRDISVMNTLNREIERSKDQLNALYKLVDRRNIAIDIENIVENIGPVLLEELKGAATWLYLFDKEEQTLKLQGHHGLTDRQIKELNCIDIEKCRCNFTLGSIPKKLASIKEMQYCTGVRFCEMDMIKYVSTYPIIFGGKLLGVICIGFKDNEGISYKKGIFIDTILNQLGMVIKNKALFDDAKKELGNRVKAEEELRLFFNTAKELMSISNEEGQFIKFNSEWENVLGWSNDEIFINGMFGTIYEEDKEVLINAFKEKKDLCEQSVRHICKDGTYRWISWKLKYVQSRNVFVATGRDLTESIKMREKTKELEKAVEIESIRNEFFANISHEFKTPLNIILTTMQLIVQNIYAGKIAADESVDLAKYTKAIKQNSYRLLRLVNNLIDMTKIDAGYYEIVLGNYNIISIVEDITLSVSSYMEEKGLNLIFDTEVEEQIIACDPEKIERIMLNLLSNAVKYSENNGDVLVDIRGDEEFITVSVKDSGIGISEEQQEVIFERFRQVDNVLSRRVEGSGIGLSLVKSLVEMHNGKIQVESELGKGSTFSFILPNRCIEENEEKFRCTDLTDSLIRKGKIEFSDIYS